MKYPQNIQDLCSVIDPDMMGFIFYPKSPRNISDQISTELLDLIPKKIKKVGVFVNENIDKVLKLGIEYKLDYIQLHGNEEVAYCSFLQNQGYKIIKAFSVANISDLAISDKYSDSCDLFLFDTKGKSHGGNGTTFDWSILNIYEIQKPFLLSGGINVDHIEEIIELKKTQPLLVGIDVNSKFEIEPGLKDIKLISNLKQKLSSIN